MSNIKHELRVARPKLRMVSPLAHAIVLVMVLFNVVLGINLIFNIDQGRLSASLIIVNDVLTFKFWGVVFILIGLIKLYALVTNNWKVSRQSLLLGVSIKAMWAIALVVRIFISPGTLLMATLWLCIAALQMACYIFFMPPNIENYNQRRIDRK